MLMHSRFEFCDELYVYIDPKQLIVCFIHLFIHSFFSFFDIRLSTAMWLLWSVLLWSMLACLAVQRNEIAHFVS